MNACWCPRCDFMFASKVNPRGTTEDPGCNGLLPVLCGSCHAEFVVPTESPWGMHPGERVELCTVEVLAWSTHETWRAPYPSRTRLVRTGVVTFAKDGKHPIGEQVDVSQLSCPTCHALAAIRMLPEPGPCPQCGQAELQWDVME